MKKIVITLLFVLSFISASAQIIFWGKQSQPYYNEATGEWTVQQVATPLAVYNISDIDSVAFSEGEKAPAAYPQVQATSGYVTLVWNIDDSFNCYGFAFAGNYNNWNVSFDTYQYEDVTYAALAKFEKIQDNWYKCLIPTDKLSENEYNVVGKCGQLGKDGLWPTLWDYQWYSTDNINLSATVLFGNADIQTDYFNEITITIPKDAGVVYIASTEFKSNVCLEKTVTATINIETTIPVTDNGVVYIVGNAFEKSWEPDAYPMTKIDNSHWTITLPATIGKEFKFVVNGQWDNDQVNGLDADQCPIISGNVKLTDETMNLTVYGFINYGVNSCY